MKNVFFCLFTAAVLLAFSSCKHSPVIVGQWNFQRIIFGKESSDTMSNVIQQQMELAMKGTRFDFREGAAVVRTARGKEETGTWMLDEEHKRLTTKINDKTKEFDVVELSDSLLDLSSPMAKKIIVRFRREK
ncbi:MAG: lipocalin family protein [Crocinitomicaceae bacterium]|nr:lipocalin family protein [Crocinitomicaceae bacterium]